MVSIGIDPSINSTGVCVISFDETTKKISTSYYIITGHATKNTKDFAELNRVTILEYDKQTKGKDSDYTTKEISKYNNFRAICDRVSDILRRHNPDYVTMEGISYGSVGSSALVDLAGLNFMLRDVISKSCSCEMTIISPTENKRFAVGCGSINKDAIIAAWTRCDDIKAVKNAKIDDIADAYFMALYNSVTAGDFKAVFEKHDIDLSPYKKKRKVKSNDDEDVMRVFADILPVGKSV